MKFWAFGRPSSTTTKKGRTSRFAPRRSLPGSSCALFVLLPLDEPAEILHRPHVELANALFRDAELLADLFEGHAFGIVEAGTHADDLLLARIEILQEAVDAVAGLFGGGHGFVLVTPRIGGGVEELVVA